MSKFEIVDVAPGVKRLHLKRKNEAKEAVRQHGAVHVMWCLSLNAEQLHSLSVTDEETYWHVVEVRRLVNEQLARNFRNVIAFD